MHFVWVDSLRCDQWGNYADLMVNGVAQRMRQIEVGEKNALWVADTACTQALWLAVMKNNPAAFELSLEHPVEQVSWLAVQFFLSQLNRKIDGLNARLPTETEWVLACRAGTLTPYAYGETLLLQQANFLGSSTVAVKSLPSNAFGLYEMHGNLWEWTKSDADRWGNQKIIRGGSWALDAEAARVDSWGKSAIANRDYTIGFRFVV